MTRINSLSIALSGSIVFCAAFAMLSPSPAQADCAQWDISGDWEFQQANGITAYVYYVVQTGTAIQGTAHYTLHRDTDAPLGHRVQGSVAGTVNGNNIELFTSWGAKYTGGVGSDGFIGGSTRDADGNVATWRSNRAATCQVAEAPEKPVKKLGKRLPGTSTTSDLPQPQKPVKQLGKRKILASVTKTVEVYDLPDGKGKKLGDLTTPNTVELAAGSCRDSWCNVQGPPVPTGIGWVYDGQDYDSLEWLPAR